MAQNHSGDMGATIVPILIALLHTLFIAFLKSFYWLRRLRLNRAELPPQSSFSSHAPSFNYFPTPPSFLVITAKMAAKFLIHEKIWFGRFKYNDAIQVLPVSRRGAKPFQSDLLDTKVSWECLENQNLYNEGIYPYLALSDCKLT